MNKENRPIKVSIADVKDALERGNLAWIRCEVQEALDTWQSGLEQADRVTQEEPAVIAGLRCRLWARIAEVWLAQGRLPEAAEAVEKVERQAGACACTHPELNVHARLLRAHIARVQRDMGQAQQLVREALRMAEGLAPGEGKRRTLAIAHLEHGMTALEMSESHAAMNALLQARALYQQLDDRAGEAHVLVMMGRLYGQMSLPDQAITHFQEANALLQDVAHDPTVNYTHQMGWGAALGGAERYAESLVCFQAALDLARRLGSEPYLAAGLNNVGVSLQSQGEMEKALELHREALELFRHLHDSRGISASLNNIGEIYLELGDADEALLTLKQAIRSATSINFRAIFPETYCLLSAAYLLLDRPSTAFDHAEKALHLAEEIGNLGYAGMAYRALGVAAAALERQGRLPPVVPPGGPESYFSTSLEILKGINFAYEQARTLLAWGRYLRESRELARRAKSESYLKRAAEQFEQLGLPIPSPSRLGQTA